jgi:anti-sigma regulatory factor (Ser/Thr protein kinase)
MGKGVAAALIGAGIKQEFSKVRAAGAIAAEGSDQPLQPAALVNELHQRVFPSLHRLESFVTLALLRFDPAQQTITYVDAGHTKSILTTAAGTQLVEGENMPLGVIADEHYVQHQTAWRPGDLLLIYSDGLSEAMNSEGELFGADRLASMVAALHGQQAPASVVVQSIRARVRTFQSDDMPSDDSTCILVHFDHPDDRGEPALHLDLAWDPAELSTLRAEISSAARAAGFENDAMDALVLAVSETATNIMRHVPQPGRDARIHCRAVYMPLGISVAFHYLGEAFQDPYSEPDFSGASDGGFGLYIVRHSVDEVEYRDLGYGVQRIRLTKHRSVMGDHAPESS